MDPANPNESGQPATPLSKNAEKNEAKRRAKMEKFAAKKAAMAVGDGKKTAAPKEKKAAKAEAPAKPVEPEFVNLTPAGEKKIMEEEMAASYNPKAVEAAWYAWWEKEGYFKPQLTPEGNAKPEGTFVIPIPPPNVTGSLHIGHGLTVAIQDTLIRWHRMRGETTLFNPGMDHAGISTQAVVEKMLWKEEGLTRHDIGREAFLAKVWEWKENYGGRIQNQLRRLGGSYDWSRSRFTMDPDMTEAVNEHFIRLFDDGTIYRATRLVNWCVHLNTALSNLEVDNKELSGSTYLTVPGYGPEEKFQFGVLVCFQYQIEGSDERLTVATTRVETMLGDSAIAVHPNDPRYKHLHGKFARHPFIDRRIPIITDDQAVDMEFGTGAVKITPAHDFNDYEVGKRHNLEFINILNDDGTFNANAGPKFEGMKRFHARVAVVGALKEAGLWVETKDNPMTVPTCSKTGDIIEPLMKPQWYVRCHDMAQEAMRVVREGQLSIMPATSEREWFRWLENIQDWCISRQLWWGHRVPAYLVVLDGTRPDPTDMHYWVVGRSEEEARTSAAARFPNQSFTLERDPDVLDTWFSSALWPFSIHGWPNATTDYRNFYPATLLETGWDIIFFWVARMVMVGLKLTGQVPFQEVFCHAMIRDAHGRKMSKSLGNVIDPIDVIEGIDLASLHAKLYQGNLDPREIEKAKAGQAADFPRGIPECGTDALRFALCAYTSTGRDLNLDILRVEGYRKFCNKLWNATRFAMMKLGGASFKPTAQVESTGPTSLADRWILHKLNAATAEVNAALAENNFMAATTAVHRFWLYELCDVYIEAIKPVCDVDDSTTDVARLAAKATAQQTLYTCLDWGLKLLHPFMPFITEELFQRLPRRPESDETSIMVAKYPGPVPSFTDPTSEREFDLILAATRAIRSLMSDYGLTSKGQAYLTSTTPALHALYASQADLMQALIRGCQQVTALAPETPSPAGCALVTLNDETNVLLLVKGIVDIDGEITKLNQKLGKVQQQLESWSKKTTIADYETKIKAEVRELNASRIKNYEAEIEAITQGIQNFMTLKN
ncbi:valine--tRNA ligase [Dimargaris cristalligena]|uniref:Probable valine--tRNA ligase, cytoplasmic n=1 Tax=Dimargaris cristalligena TaxID=215637 RepID=A0A4P9ZTK5_9FUNG|nr:valine--tRNA ligase [Dimargaris cristalligena]RKP36082.1 tRNA synthetases class I-domain-containing protein [Dimargaris cristalligena]|eukprot:RKP36082.1 tRNA synthetases class I-domain-containing protein [Dimargaris cristalligena]